MDWCLGQAPRALAAGNKFVQSTSHGGKTAAFAYPLTGPGRGSGINMETATALAQKAYWVTKHYPRHMIDRYLDTYPSDMAVGVWWQSLNLDNRNLNPPGTV